MIYATLFDGGTVPVKPANAIPGMDSLYYREADFEENIGEDKRARTNAELMDVEPIELAPWPAPFPGKAWVDLAPQYEADGDDGLHFELHARDDIAGDYHPAPAGDVRIVRDPSPILEPSEARIATALDWREVQAWRGANWLRLDLGNETGGTRLRDPLALAFAGLRGSAWRLVLPDNSLFTPFDLTHPERYRITDDDGRRLDSEHWLDLRPGGRFRLYLRPRRWRYVATVIAHYWIATWFESFPADEVFTRAHFDRPPFYPYRHDVLHTADVAFLPNFYGVPRAYDSGIDWQWSHSRNANALRIEIIEGQDFGLCYAKILVNTEDADVTVWRYAPRAGEVVLGIGRVDDVTGAESRVWLHQLRDGAEHYPDTVLGQFLVPYYVTAAG